MECKLMSISTINGLDRVFCHHDTETVIKCARRCWNSSKFQILYDNKFVSWAFVFVALVYSCSELLIWFESNDNCGASFYTGTQTTPLIIKTLINGCVFVTLRDRVLTKTINRVVTRNKLACWEICNVVWVCLCDVYFIASFVTLISGPWYTLSIGIIVI